MRIFGNGNRLGVAVNGGGGCVDHRDSCVRTPDGVEQGDRAAQVDAVGTGPVGDAALDRGDRGEVEAAVHANHRCLRGGGDGDVALDEFHPVGQVFPVSGRQVVQDPHPVAARDQRVAKMRTDEPGAAGDEVGRHGLPVGLQDLPQHRSIGQPVEPFVDLLKRQKTAAQLVHRQLAALIQDRKSVV